MVMHHLKRIVGDWRDYSTDETGMLGDGIYFTSAKAFGLKGYLGGVHSWLTYVKRGKHTVIETTDRETLIVQRAKKIIPLSPVENDEQKTVFISDRNGTQQWFGMKPVYWEILPTNLISLKTIEDIAKSYPYLGHEFDLFKLNCNTFMSWLHYRVEQHVDMKLNRLKNVSLGGRSAAYWSKVE